MAKTHNTTLQVLAGNTLISHTVVSSSSSLKSVEDTIADSATDFAINEMVDVTTLKSLYIVCDQDVTLETNDGTTPQETILLKKDQPLVWLSSNAYFTIPFAGDVTGFFVTNASGATATLKMEILQDSSP